MGQRGLELAKERFDRRLLASQFVDWFGKGCYRVKRLFDIVLMLLVMPIWILMMLVLMLLVRVKLGSPIFFTQTRPGLHGKPFTLINSAL